MRREIEARITWSSRIKAFQVHSQSIINTLEQAIGDRIGTQFTHENLCNPPSGRATPPCTWTKEKSSVENTSCGCGTWDPHAAESRSHVALPWDQGSDGSVAHVKRC